MRLIVAGCKCYTLLSSNVYATGLKFFCVSVYYRFGLSLRLVGFCAFSLSTCPISTVFLSLS